MSEYREVSKFRVSGTDVARAAGVSQATVSYVFSGRKGATVPESTRLRVMKAAEELGYSPNRFAQSLKTGKTNVVSFWAEPLRAAITVDVLDHVRRCADADGYELIVSGTSNSGTVAQWPVDGILAFDSPSQVHNIRRVVQASQTPFVSIGVYHLDDVDFVDIDLRTGAVRAMEHLLRHNPHRLAYLVSEGTNHPHEPRLNAYMAEIEKTSLLPEVIVAPDNLRATARDVIRGHVALHGAPDALFCMNDEMAIGAHRGLRDMGLSIPDQVMLMGCDGIEDMEYHDPPISTIVQPLEEACSIAWCFLRNRLADRSTPQQRATLVPTLRLRGSTRA